MGIVIITVDTEKLAKDLARDIKKEANRRLKLLRKPNQSHGKAT